MGRTLGRIIFFGASVVVVVLELAWSFSSSTYSSSAYSASPSYEKMFRVEISVTHILNTIKYKVISCLMDSSFCGCCCRLLEYVFSVTDLLREQTISFLCILCSHQCAYNNQWYKGNGQYAVNRKNFVYQNFAI
jgi:hypothetical protein